MTVTPIGRGDRPAGRPYATRSAVVARNGIAATSHPLASFVAVEILKDGGTAVDAAIAANAALGLMEPVNCGPGGDLFAIVWDPAAGKLHGLNASGRSPRGQSYSDLQAKLSGQRIPEYGPLSVTVPGAVDGWFELHDRFGLLPMDTLLAPAISYAREGVAIPQVIAHLWREASDEYERSGGLVGEMDGFRRTYMVDGGVPREGDLFRNPDLASTYELIADGGRGSFYRGEIADVIDRYMRRVGGMLRRTDLEAHRSTWIEPVSSSYRDVEVYELPPSGQGIAVLQMLNILEGYELADMNHNGADYLHVHLEAKKLAFEDRARYYGDPDFQEIPVDELISKEYAEKRRAQVRMNQALLDPVAGDPHLRGGETIYLTTADADGMLVSLIQSNYVAMGSGLVPDGLGFGLQNRGTLFSMEEGHANVYAPGKRPFHTIIPAFVMKDSRPFLSFGVMGGDMQPQGHAQILCNIVDFGMNVQEAGDVARYRHEGSSSPVGNVVKDGGVVRLETGISDSVRADLRSRGHRLADAAGSFGGYQAILVDADTGSYFGASEMRKDGQAVGY